LGQVVGGRQRRSSKRQWAPRPANTAGQFGHRAGTLLIVGTAPGLARCLRSSTSHMHASSLKRASFRRLEIPEGPRIIARNAIIAISSLAPADFAAIADELYCIPADEWKFSEYHAAAAAAVQEDGKLNKLTYACVPRRLSESDFWRLVRCSSPLPIARLLHADLSG